MAGLVNGSVEHYLNNRDGLSNASEGMGVNSFVAIAKFFDTHMTRIASHAGGSPVGTVNSNSITGWYGSSQYCRGNQYGVWRWDRIDGLKIYIYMHLYNSNVSTTSLGTYTLVQNSSSNQFNLCFSFAFDTSGGNPWEGGVANAGADTKANPVWGTDGGVLYCFPASNSPGGYTATSRGGVCGSFSTNNAENMKLHIMKDDDALYFLADYNNQGAYGDLFYFGTYTPRKELEHPYPIMWMNISNRQLADISWDGIIGAGLSYGSVTNYYNGGIITGGTSNGKIRDFMITSFSRINEAPYEANRYTGQFEIFPWFLRAYDSTFEFEYGLLGQIPKENLGLTTNLQTNTLIKDREKIVIGSYFAPSLWKFVFPWKSGIIPESGYRKEGIQF